MRRLQIKNTEPATNSKRCAMGLLDKSGRVHLPPERLEEIFCILPLRDLLTCRLVHPSWRICATTPCRMKTAPIQFSKQAIGFRVALLRHFITSFNEADMETFPVAKFHLDLNTNSRWLHKFSRVELHQFFKTIASVATDLTLRINLATEYQYHHGHLPTDLEMEKLKLLYLDVSADHPPEIEDSTITNFVRGIMKKANAGQATCLVDRSYCGNKYTIPWCIREFGIMSKLRLLTTLTIKARFEKVDWHTLANLGLTLEDLSISVEFHPVDSTLLQEFLQSQSETLKKLQITYSNDLPPNISPILISFPQLTRLESLALSTRSYFEPTAPVKFQIRSISYPEQLPTLKRLCLHSAPHVWECFLRYELQPSNSVEELILPEDFHFEMAVIKAAAVFPNLKKLHISAHVDLITAVYGHMINIEELTLFVNGPQNVDEIITGVKSSDKFIPFNGSREAREKAWFQWLKNSSRNSLASLENLKILRLKKTFDIPGRLLEFSEATAAVLKQMKSLRRLDLGVRERIVLVNRPGASSSSSSVEFQENALLEDLKKHFDVVLKSPTDRTLGNNFYQELGGSNVAQEWILMKEGVP